MCVAYSILTRVITAGMCVWKCLSAGWLGSPHYFPVLRLCVAHHLKKLPKDKWFEVSAGLTKEDVPSLLHDRLFEEDNLLQEPFADAIADFSSTRKSERLIESNNTLIQLISNIIGVGIAIINVDLKPSVSAGVRVLTIKPPGVTIDCPGWIVLRQEMEDHFKLLFPTTADPFGEGETCAMPVQIEFWI